MSSCRCLVRQTTFASLVVSFSATAALPTIRPGEVWPDDRGKHIQAHGGGILKLGTGYYWFGEDRSQGLERDKRYVSCYASTDLAHWTFRRQVIRLPDPENLGPRWVFERPKTFFNAGTKTFVM